MAQIVQKYDGKITGHGFKPQEGKFAIFAEKENQEEIIKELKRFDENIMNVIVFENFTIHLQED